MKSLIAVIVLALLCAGGYVGFQKWNSRESNEPLEVVSVKLERDRFTHDVVERGEIESSSNVEIRCQVKSRNSAGIAILEVVDEGTEVKEGDIVCRLDASALEQELVQQQIACNTTEAAKIQARNAFEAAKIAKKEYVEGTFNQEKQLIQSEIFVAEENLRRSQEYVTYSERLAARGYATAQQLEGDRFAVQKAKTELDAAKTKLRVLVEFTKAKMIKQLDSDIKTAEAQWQSEQNSHQLELSKLAEIEAEIERCVLRAPTAGQVVHANESSRRGDNDFIVEPGAMVREGRVIIRLPDPSQMQVKAKVNESQVTLLSAGMPAKVRLDAFGDQLLNGVVTRVNEYPEPTSWYSSQVKEYATFVRVDDAIAGIKPGLTAEVQIQVARNDDVVQVPVQAIHEHNRRTYYFVRDGNDWQPQEITIVGNNDKFVIAKEELNEGDIVAMNPEALLDRVVLPEVEPAPAAESVALVASKPTPPAPSAQRPTRKGTPPGAGGGMDASAIVDAIFQRTDKNKDGMLSKDELPAERAQQMSKSDKNGDGNIDKAEMLQAMRAMSGGGGQ